MEFSVVDVGDKKGKEIHLTIPPHDKAETFVLAYWRHDAADKLDVKISQAVSAMWVT